VRAVVVSRPTEPAALTVQEHPRPRIAPDSIRIKVKAAGVNFADTLIARGRYQIKPDYPFVPGAEAAGEVIEIGSAVPPEYRARRVMVHTITGAFAEEVVVPARTAFEIPNGISCEQAAAFPVVYPTAHAALVDRGALREGETVLVHAAAGGVGLAAVQIAKALGAFVIATAGGATKLDFVRRAGADVLIDHRRESVSDAVTKTTRGAGVDLCLDTVGGDVTDVSVRCLDWKGRLVVVGFASGVIPHLALNRVMLRNISVVGLHWGAYIDADYGVYRDTVEATIRMLNDRDVEPVVSRIVPMDDVGELLADIENRRVVGKTVLSVAEV